MAKTEKASTETRKHFSNLISRYSSSELLQWLNQEYGFHEQKCKMPISNEIYY